MLLKNTFYTFLFSIIMTSLVACTGTRPENLGVDPVSHQFRPCPKSPNCILTQSSDKQSTIEPLKYDSTLTLKEVATNLVETAKQMKRTNIVVEKDDYVYVEYTSKLFRFVDDVEFWIDTTAHIVHFRSASRLGKSDLGANRKRMENFRTLFEDQTKK